MYCYDYEDSEKCWAVDQNNSKILGQIFRDSEEIVRDSEEDE